MTIFLRLLRYALYLALAGVLLGGLAIGTAYLLIAPGLPSVETLKDVRLQVPLRIESADVAASRRLDENDRDDLVGDRRERVARRNHRRRRSLASDCRESVLGGHFTIALGGVRHARGRGLDS